MQVILGYVTSYKNHIEKLNTTMCNIPGLKKQVSNVAAKIEMGRYPIFIDAIKNCLNNWHRIHSGKGNYLIQLMNQNCSEYGNWNKRIKNILEKHRFGKDINIDHFSVDLPKIIMRLKDCVIQTYFSILKKQNKMRTYAKHKQDIKLESYVTKLSFSARQTVSKLRLSDHSLEIERGKYQRPYLKPEERNCPFSPDKIEDEYQIFIECAMYRDGRQTFLNSSYNHKSYSHANQNKLFSHIFKCHEAHITKISSFINTINGIRDEKLQTFTE